MGQQLADAIRGNKSAKIPSEERRAFIRRTEEVAKQIPSTIALHFQKFIDSVILHLILKLNEKNIIYS